MGFWSDAFRQGREWIQSEADQRKSQVGQSAHIAYQEQAVSDFETDALTPYRNGSISATQAKQIIQNISDSFNVFAQRLGYPRALAGANDVTNLARTLISSLNQAPSGGNGIPPEVNLPVIGGVSTTTLVLGLGLAYMFFKRR